MRITVDALRRFAGAGAKEAVLAAMAGRAELDLPRFGITTRLRLQHFFAQIAEESGGFKVFEENLNYTAARLVQVWPSRFPSAAAAQPYARNPKALAIYVYGSRLGNRPGTEDGWTYRGRGPMQLTGRENYRTIGKLCGLPLEADPDLAGRPENYLLVAAAFWSRARCNAAADRDDILAVTKLVNGGTVNLAARKAWLVKARRVFVDDLDADGADAKSASHSSPIPPAIPPDLPPISPPEPKAPATKGVTTGIVVAGGIAATQQAQKHGASVPVIAGIAVAAAIIAIAVWKFWPRKDPS